MRYGADGAGLPEHIGGYAVERELGAGGMGTVYLARSRGGRAVAVKVARPELASDPHFRERFRAEVAAARSVGGFHTAPVVDADPAAEAPWLATAYVPGPTLAGLLDAEGPMDEARLRRLGAALAEALEAIHRCGLVHRDLKPGNIIMASDGPRVLDFGIARALESPRLTATGMAFGTPGFLAPEQAQGQEVGPAADVFALGAVLVAAAGGSAFGAGTPMGMMYRSVHEQPDLTAVPDGLRPVVASCLAKSPDQRPALGHLLDLIAPATARYSPTVAIPPPPSHAPSIPVPVYQAPAGYGNGNGYGGGAPPVDDPVFLAVAPDSALMVDGMGVTIDFRFRSLQFGWEEIRTVQYAPEGPKHLRVVVHLHDGTAHPCLLAARRRSRLKEWLIDLPMILACFT
ncbi:serine/threonine-protein kinase [Streptomyces sp. NBC_01438]|uniref:serine/threonine-protein kinase n=1 Tax=Streptomyces sp. NBC_01438 TaxID=2903866 RepID=UPI00324FC1D2